MDPTQQPQAALDPQALQRFIQLMQSKGGAAGAIAPSGPAPAGTSGRVGQTPNVMTPPNIVWDPKTAIGNPGPPAAQQQTGAPTYKPDQSMSAAMMQHLDPKGAATFSAIQGIGQFLGQLDERKQKNQAAEATNLAQNLMTAIDNKDINGMIAIMGDPKKMKVINKVYKGWIQQAEQQAEEAAKPQKQEPKDPDTEGFNQGVQLHIDKKMQKQQQMQQMLQAAKKVGYNSEGTPTSIGNYRIPQAGPAQQLGNATQSAQLQYAKDNPDSLIEGPMTPARIAQEQKFQEELARSKEGVIKAQEETKKVQLEVQGKSLDLQKQQQELTNLVAKGQINQQEGQKKLEALGVQKMELGVKLDIARFNSQAAMFRMMSARDKQTNPKQKQLPTQLMLKYNSAQKALGLLQSIQGGDRGFTKSDVTTLQQELHDSGADMLVKSLPQSMWSRWVSGDNDTTDALNALNQHISGMKKTFDTQYPGWNKDESGKPNAARDPVSPKVESKEQVDDTPPPQGDDTHIPIDLTSGGGDAQ